ncbi:uncharacterized protein LOC128175433 [Crassostrea angulata]|uniref:uncharacterized protein LOC128175433 n=1 Tax=Magallana angulata TaxID=2784310 RepID=UPI0022B0F3F4|nr:uncharacterized protein LOC128175433 [Crassostrea angulata]
MFAFVVFLAAVAFLNAAPKHIGETDLTAQPLSNNITAHDKRDEGSYLSALEKASEKEASVLAKYKHTIVLFAKIAKHLPVEKRENITNTLRYIFLKLKKFEDKSSAADDGDLKKSFEGKKLKELNINKSKSIGNSTYLESRHHVDHSALNNNTDNYLIDVLSSKHLDAKAKHFLKDLLLAKKTHSQIRLPPIHPLMFEFDNEGVKREKIKKDEDKSEEEYDNDNDKQHEVKIDSAGRTDSNEDPISNFAQFPNGILFDDEDVTPLQTNQNILSVSQVAPASWNQFQPENIMHRNINPEIGFNDLLASSTQMDENINLYNELTDIFGFPEKEIEAVEKKQERRGDLTKNTFSNHAMLSNAVEKFSDDNKNKDDSKELNEKYVSEQFVHSNSIQKAMENTIQFEDNHARNLKRSQNVNPSSDTGSDRNLVHHLAKSEIPDTFLASSLQKIHTLDADGHFKEIPDPEKEIKALENLLKLAEGFSGPKNQHSQSFQDQNNFFIPLDEGQMFLQYLQGGGDDAIKDDEQESESEEENVLQINVENRNGNRLLQRNSANEGDKEISPQSSSKNLIAALFPMEKQPEVNVIQFSGSQKEQKEESSEEMFKEKASIFRPDVLAQSRIFETERNDVELNTENSNESEEAGTTIVLSARQQGHHQVISDVQNKKTSSNSISKEQDSSISGSNEQDSSNSGSDKVGIGNSERNEQVSSISGSNELDSNISGISKQDSSHSTSIEHDSSNSGSNEQDSSKSESNEQDSSKSDSSKSESNEKDSSKSDSSKSDSSKSDSSKSESNEQDSSKSDSSKSESNEQDSSKSDSSKSESNEQDSSKSESSEQDSSKSESNEQDSSISGSIDQDSSDESQESEDSESQETRPVVFPPINHLDYIGDQLTRIDESKRERKIRKDVKPTNVIVRDHKPDVLPRQPFPHNDIPKDDLVFPRVQPKNEKRYVPNLPEDKRILLDIPVDNPVREINSDWNFDEVDDDLNLVTPIANDDDLFIAIQNIERRLPKDMERNKRQNLYKKKTNYGYNGIIRLTSKYSNRKGIKHKRYSTKYKKILPYTENLHRNDVGYIEPEIFDRFLPYSDDTDEFREGQIYRDSFGYQGPYSMYKKSTHSGNGLIKLTPEELHELNVIYKDSLRHQSLDSLYRKSMHSGHRLLKLTAKELHELNKIYMDSLGYQSLDSLYKKSTHSGNLLLKLTAKELEELNQIYRATRKYRPAPFAKSRNHHYSVLQSPHRILNEQIRGNGDRSTDRISYGGRSLFGRRLLERRIFNEEMTRPRHRAFSRQGFHRHPRANHLSENRAYSYPDINTRRQR